MSGGDVRVLGTWGSPFSKRVEFALKLKGVPYEFMEEDLLNKSSLLLKYNPVHKQIPVLVHNGKPIAESMVIVEYIDETWSGGNPILPNDPYERAMARFWAKYIDEKCLPAARPAVLGGEEKAVEEARGHLENLENELKGKKFFGGESIGFVDIAACFFGFWMWLVQDVTGNQVLTKEKFPNLCKWAEELRSCSVIKENLPPKDKLLAHFKTLFAPGGADASKTK